MRDEGGLHAALCLLHLCFERDTILNVCKLSQEKAITSVEKDKCAIESSVMMFEGLCILKLSSLLLMTQESEALTKTTSRKPPHSARPTPKLHFRAPPRIPHATPWLASQQAVHFMLGAHSFTHSLTSRTSLQAMQRPVQ